MAMIQQMEGKVVAGGHGMDQIDEKQREIQQKKRKQQLQLKKKRKLEQRELDA